MAETERPTPNVQRRASNGRRRAALCLASIALLLPSLTGCYNYGFGGQFEQFLWGANIEKAHKDVIYGPDARSRREAMIRLARWTVFLDDDPEGHRSVRTLIGYGTCSLYQETPLVRATAAQLLKQVGTQNEVRLLLRSLDGDEALLLGPEKSTVVRREVVRTYGWLGKPADIRYLAPVLASDDDGETRKRAAAAIARLGSKGAIPPLIGGLGDRVESVVVACWEGLHRLTGQDLPPSQWSWREWWKTAKDKPEPPGAAPPSPSAGPAPGAAPPRSPSAPTQGGGASASARPRTSARLPS